MSPRPARSDDTAEERAPWVDLRERMAGLSDDDSLRLEYAHQWRIDGIGDPRRAHLIEIQVKQQRLASGWDHPEWAVLDREAARILAQIGNQITPSWFERQEISDAVFHRGFIEQVSVPCGVMLSLPHRERLFKCALIRHLNIHSMDDARDFQNLIATGCLSRLRSLSVPAQHVDDTGILRMLEMDLRGLEWLDLSCNAITKLGVLALADATLEGRLPKLRFVNLTGNPYDPSERVEEDLGVAVGVSRSKACADLEQESGPLPRWLLRDAQRARAQVLDRLNARLQAPRAAFAD